MHLEEVANEARTCAAQQQSPNPPVSFTTT